jgi:hypothetical protein
MQFRKIFEGTADEPKTFELINRGYSPDVFQAGDWFECQEDEYFYFLECMPPMDFSFGGFSMCEFSTGNLTNAFVKRAGRNYCLTIQRRNAADFELSMREFNRELECQPGAAQQVTFA